MAEARITIDAQLQFRHDVEANWLAADPILKVGEPAYTIGYSDRFKLGDGQSKWSELPYLQLGEGGGGGGSQAYESLAWSAIKNLTSGSASVLAQAYAVKQAYTELKSLIPNLADYYTKDQINALIPSLAGYATEAWVLGKGYATESFVNTKIADLINGAPTTLDTLKEIADAFAQSQDVIEALDEAIGKKANQSDLTALAARVSANEGNISNKLDKSIWDSVFEIDEKGNLRAKVGIYSTSFISARTSDPSAGGGSGSAFSLYNWEQVKAMTAEVGGVAPTAYALKQAYNELINATPTLSWNNIQDKPIFATVATSGSYSDLIGRPTALSDLANDVGYITSAAIPSLAGYATESWVGSNYLAKSGGTITSTDTYGLVINAGADASGLQLQTNGTLKGILIGGGTWGAAILNGNTFNGIGVLDDGTPYFKDLYNTRETYTLIHSGNIGSQSVNYANSAGALTTSGNIAAQANSNRSVFFQNYITFDSNAAYGICRGSYVSGRLGATDLYISAQNAIVLEGGKVGINTLTPQYDLHVDGTMYGNLKMSTPRTIWGQSFDGTGDIEITTSAQMKYLGFTGIDGTTEVGYVGRGSNSNNDIVVAASTTNGNVRILAGGNSDKCIYLDSAGNVGIGTTTDSGYKLYANGSLYASSISTQAVFNFLRTSASYIWMEPGGYLNIGTKEIGENSMSAASLTIRAYDILPGSRNNAVSLGGANYRWSTIYGVNGNFSGNITASGTIYSAIGMYSPGYITARSTAGSSDRNLKTNIATVRNALAYILGTNYVSFDWKDTGEHSVGIIAQDELNREWGCLVQKYDEHYSYQYTQHTALLGSALQEEDKKVEALRAEVATLKAEVQLLRNQRQLWQQ